MTGAVLDLDRLLKLRLLVARFGEMDLGEEPLPRTTPIPLLRSERDACEARLKSAIRGPGKQVVLS